MSATSARQSNARTQPTTQKITTFLWFNDNAEEAVNFYVSVFKNSKVLKTVRYGEVGPGPKGKVMTIEFELDGEKFVALNGGPEFKFTEAISLMVHCETQEEIDYYWNKLSADPASEQCGWLKDKFGVSWQIVPVDMNEMLASTDSEKVARVTEAFLKMKKFDIAKLREVYQGKTDEVVA